MANPNNVQYGFAQASDGVVNKPVVGGVLTDGITGYLKVALAAVNTAGGVLSVANPLASENVALFVTRLVVDTLTPSSGACTIDAGIAANGTTLNDTLIDGQSVATAAGTFDNIENQGTNGGSVRKWGAAQFVTISVASGASAGLTGFAYIHFNRA